MRPGSTGWRPLSPDRPGEQAHSIVRSRRIEDSGAGYAAAIRPSNRDSEVDIVAEHNTAREGIEGAVEGVKGKVKEAAGAVLDNDSLRTEGKAQQDKGESQRAAAEKENEARQQRLEAADAEQRQRAQQDPGHGQTVAPTPRDV
ncbi:CsbD family protein [Nocardia speluncae]|uniref:CsbD family protein n=1 Tax=Nocardia speluncae TaxID=419477 RepID=A0A846XCI4_9NOCA|nr:CsbD family protein [Nocardia speluncae]